MAYKKLRAYSVQGDETGCVVFAHSNVIARNAPMNSIFSLNE